MKPEDQRTAIAKAFPEIIGLSSSGAWMWRDQQKRWHCCYPENDPLSDLNAMNEAWMSKDPETRIEMHQELMDIINRDNTSPNYPLEYKDVVCLEQWTIDAFEATAAQRAEALLKTLGLWKP